MTAVHICIYICDSAEAILLFDFFFFFFVFLVLLFEAAYQLLFPTPHKSWRLKDFQKSFSEFRIRGKEWRGFRGEKIADRMKRSWGPIEMLRKWSFFFFFFPQVAQG